MCWTRVMTDSTRAPFLEIACHSIQVTRKLASTVAIASEKWMSYEFAIRALAAGSESAPNAPVTSIKPMQSSIPGSMRYLSLMF